MRKATALVLGVLLALLGLSGTGQAQSSVQVQGTIQAVDCQAQTVVLSAPGSSNTIAAAPYTAVLVNSTSVPFCTLTQYVGAHASAWLVATGSEFVATRIDVVGRVAVVPVAPATAVVEPLPIEGIVLGTIIVAGLLFLLARDEDEHVYCYPYYGRYYRHYYRPEYRPYPGPFPRRLPPVITVPHRIAGTVLGTTNVDGLAYLMVRDRDGRFARYPYYGPYHRYYYSPEYHPYHGQYRDAPVRQGDVHWDGLVYRDGQNNQGGSESRGAGGPPPVRQGDPRMTPPVVAPGYRDGQNNQGGSESRGAGGPPPVRQSDPRMTPPFMPLVYRDGQGTQGGDNDPAYHRPDRNQSASQNDRRRDAPNYRGPSTRCQGLPNQPCSDD